MSHNTAHHTANTCNLMQRIIWPIHFSVCCNATCYIANTCNVMQFITCISYNYMANLCSVMQCIVWLVFICSLVLYSKYI